MDVLEEDLTCPICCCLFDDPRVLPCSHNFCKKCLEDILEENRTAFHKLPFKCPTCRKEISTALNFMQINYVLRAIVEKYNQLKVTPEMSLCKKHTSQPLNIFCSTDLRLICGFCVTMPEHKGHTFWSIEEACQQEKKAFVALSCQLTSWHATDVKSCLERLDTGKKEVLQLVSKDADRVAEYFNRLIQTLEHKKNEILSDFETMKLVIMQTYDPEINKLNKVLEEHASALHIINSFTETADSFTFLLKMQDMREKLTRIQDVILPSHGDTSAHHLMKSFDTKQWDDVKLKDIDKLAAPHEKCVFQFTKQKYSWVFWSFVFCACLFIILMMMEFFNISGLAKSAFNIWRSIFLNSELTDYMGWCWSELENFSLLFYDYFQESKLVVLNHVAEFVCYYRL
ncbi:tripartite motif-containing 13 [Erpetoichthys calabaricus]|uniref:Tripartite motif containing 13 n=1 Tax=Erpetoichthys calabaricus TaxID=27687 RepID=A0A8C4T394_ERPCA|nr:tripartite motif-containing 13 [Erpetoichthys calabaricus]